VRFVQLSKRLSASKALEKMLGVCQTFSMGFQSNVEIGKAKNLMLIKTSFELSIFGQMLKLVFSFKTTPTNSLILSFKPHYSKTTLTFTRVDKV